MSASDFLEGMILDGEREWITSVVANLSDDDRKLVYADWLEDHGDERSAFLRRYVAALRSMSPDDFPSDEGLSEEWLELIGYWLAREIAEADVPELLEPAFRLARPALRMEKIEQDDDEIAIGASKIGGLPDLPPGIAWPIGDDCKAIFWEDTVGDERLAGFLAQVNLEEIALTQAAKDLPKTGVLSFFCFQDVENDRPGLLGTRALLLPSTARLERRNPPAKLIEGNHVMPAAKLLLVETLDVPTAWHGPWSDELNQDPGTKNHEALDLLREVNFYNVLGYARDTTGADPTPHRQSRHLILLKNSVGFKLHIQIHEKDLASRNFDAITLNWVDNI